MVTPPSSLTSSSILDPTVPSSSPPVSSGYMAKFNQQKLSRIEIVELSREALLQMGERVKDKTKELIGLSQVLSEEERLANAITDSILPLLTPDIEIQSSRGKELLIIRVSHGIGPYYLKSEGPERGVYVRFGSTNRSVDAEMLESVRLLAKKVSS